MRCVWPGFGTCVAYACVLSQRKGVSCVAYVACIYESCLRCVRSVCCVNSIRKGLCYVRCVELQTSLNAYHLDDQLAMLAYATFRRRCDAFVTPACVYARDMQRCDAVAKFAITSLFEHRRVMTSFLNCFQLHARMCILGTVNLSPSCVATRHSIVVSASCFITSLASYTPCERRDGDAIIASAQRSDHDAYAAIQTLMRTGVMLACLYARDM